MNKAKKLIMILVVLAALLVPVMAAQTMSVTWKWNHDDQDVAYYRYQLNGEAEESWTVVSNTVLSYEIADLDPYSSYTLYLQCSYDGENWSESAVATAEPLLVKESEVVEPVEAVIVEEPVEEVAAVEPATEESVEAIPAAVVEEAPVKPIKEKAKYGYKTNILLTAGAGTNVEYNKFALDGAFPRFGMALELQNIVHAGPWGMGLRFDINTILQPREQDWNNFDIKDLSIWYDSSADAKLMMYFGNNSFDFYFGAGAGYSIINPHFKDDAPGIKAQEDFGHSLGKLGIFSTAWYGSGNVGMRVRFNDLFSLGVEANYRYLMPAKQHTASADLVFGFTF